MIIGNVQISGTCARTVYCNTIPRGIIGAKVALEYDEELWSGLTKKAVFTNGLRTVELANPGDLVSLPPEVVDTAGKDVRIGVCGTDADGKLVIPTLWAVLSVVRNAVPVEADEAAEPTPPIWAQLMGMIGNLDDLDTDARKNLVAAVNELVARGGEIDAAEVQRIVEEYLAANMPEVKLPEALPNPHPLRLTGAVEATYDGSEAVEVEIPQGGAEKEWRLLADVEITEEVKTVEIPTLPNGESYEIGEPWR